MAAASRSSGTSPVVPPGRWIARSTASAAWSVTAISSSSSASDGRRPLSGSSTEMMPSTVPDELRSGSSSMSSESHASGSSAGATCGVQMERSPVQS
jgi:hypothetical protein